MVGRRAFAICVCALVVCAPAAAQPSFGPLRPVATLTPGGSLLDLTNADFTGDGRQDVLALRGRWASTQAYPIAILVNDRRGGFRDRTARLFDGPVPRAVWPRQALLADFNADGRPDIFIGDSGVDQPPFPGAHNHLALSTPEGHYVDRSGNLPPAVAYFHSGAAGDVDGDGDTDIFLADLGTPIRLLLNDGRGRFTAAAGRFPPSVVNQRYTRSALVDVNGDRSLDLVLLAEDHNPTSTILLNDGHGRFRELANALPPKPFGPSSIGIAVQPVDLNGDPHADLLLGYTKGDPYYKGRWIQVAVNNGDGTFSDETATRLPQSDNLSDWPYEIVTGDLDSDGSTDFAIDVGSNFCCVGRRVVPPFYINGGDGTFTSLPGSAFGDPPYGQLRLIDVNGDGHLDVLGAWQAFPVDAPEQYAAQLQTGGGPVRDGDTDGVPDTVDRCPRLAAQSANGCPRARLHRAGTAKTANAGDGGVRLNTAVKGYCPAAGFLCTGRAAAAHGSMRLGAAALKIRSGATAKVAVPLSSRGSSFLRRALTVRVKVVVTLTGPDQKSVRLSRAVRIRAPRG